MFTFNLFLYSFYSLLLRFFMDKVLFYSDLAFVNLSFVPSAFFHLFACNFIIFFFPYVEQLLCPSIFFILSIPSYRFAYILGIFSDTVYRSTP